VISTGDARRADFFALVEALERSLATRIGEGAPEDEKLLFRHAPALQFSASDVDALEQQGAHAALTTTFLGTTGPHGLLPDAMLEEPLLSEGLPTQQRAWSEVFHHRAIALFYRLLQRTRSPQMWFERVEVLTRSQGRGLSAKHLHAIAPLLATRRRGARGLERALRILVRLECGENDARVRIHELAGARIALIPAERTHLGKQRHQLGRGSILGANISDPSGEVHVEVDVSNCLPERWVEGGDLHALALATCRLFDASSTRFRITAHVSGSEGARLGRGMRLGRSAELRTSTAHAPRVVRARALT
jgi:predicted component of type VI protein secretion system